jgi:hypothetical protein
MESYLIGQTSPGWGSTGSQMAIDGFGTGITPDRNHT